MDSVRLVLRLFFGGTFVRGVREIRGV